MQLVNTAHKAVGLQNHIQVV